MQKWKVLVTVTVLNTVLVCSLWLFVVDCFQRLWYYCVYYVLETLRQWLSPVYTFTFGLEDILYLGFFDNFCLHFAKPVPVFWTMWSDLCFTDRVEGKWVVNITYNVLKAHTLSCPRISNEKLCKPSQLLDLTEKWCQYQLTLIQTLPFLFAAACSKCQFHPKQTAIFPFLQQALLSSWHVPVAPPETVERWAFISGGWNNVSLHRHD